MDRIAFAQENGYARSLIEASLDPLVTINIEGKITDMNEALTSITGISRNALRDTDFFTYFTEPKKASEVYQDVFANGSVKDSPLTIKHKNGKLTNVLFNGSVYKDILGNVLGVVIVARDVTNQTRIAKELNEAKIFAELATSIAEETSVKAEAATHIAENAVKAKQQFLSNMSHEIRTPMNAIIGFTKVLLKTELSNKQKEFLDAIKLSGDSLIVLINDILDLAKVDAGKMEFEKIPFNMASSIGVMLHLFDSKIREKNLSLIREYDKRIPEVLVGDPVRLHQVILNLVSNAVKFTSHGRITVGVELQKEDDEKVTVKFFVSDTGIGIPENKLGQIFDNFQQATSGTSRLYGGTGLGLAIVKQLIEPQGGKIEVESEVNVGSTFSFTLDFEKTREVAEVITTELDKQTEIKNIKLLVVEDIALNQLLMKTLLDDFGFESDIAANGKIALQKLEEKSYDLILMDLQMPEMNGFEATEYIRKKMYSLIPIIALTADVTTADLEKCRGVGMNDYISKPVDENLLYNKIVALVKKERILAEPINLLAKNKYKSIDLNYLSKRTKSNQLLMIELISLYLAQTPVLIFEIKQSLEQQNWKALHASVHKIIPSFAIVGINPDYEKMAIMVKDHALEQLKSDAIAEMVLEIEKVCLHACEELELEILEIKKTDSWKNLKK
ncbi:MAG: ATP-binding protein [bacterium]|nr:ATP-binding protein [bacterium]